MLVEQAVDEAKGLYKGYSRNYLPVLLPGEPTQVNHEMAVTLEGLEGGRLLGRAVEYP